LESGVTIDDALAAGVKQETIDAIFTSGAPLPVTAFSTPSTVTSAFESAPYAGQSMEQIRSGVQNYVAGLMADGVIDENERREAQAIATQQGATFQDMLAAGVDPSILFNVPAAKEPDPPVIVDPEAPVIFPQTQTEYVAPTVYQPIDFDPGIYAPGQEALDREFRDSAPRTEVLDQYGNLAGFDYMPAAKLLSATGSGFSFTPPSVTGRPRSLMDTGTLNRYTRGRSAQDLRQLTGGDQERYDQYSGLLNNRGSYGGGLSRSQLYALTRQQDSQRRATGVSASTGTISDYLRLNPDVGVDYARAQAAGELPAGTTAESFALNHYNTLGRSEIAAGTRAPFTLAQGTNRTSPIAGGNNYFSAGMGGFEGEGDSDFTTRGYDNELLARNLGPAGGAIIRPVFAEGGPVKKPKGFADGGPASADLKALDPTDPLFITETVQEVNPDMVKRDIPPMQWDGVERPTGQEASESRNMLENILSGAGKIPESVANYFVRPDETGGPSLVSLRQVGSDVAALGGAMKEGLKEDPVGFALDVLPVTGEIRSGMDADKFSDLANEARAAGDTKAADLYEQIVTLSASGAVPLMGMGARAGRRAAINAAEEAIKKGSVTEASKMLDEVDAVNAPRLELPETGRPVRASEYGADGFKAITRNMYKHQADVSTPAEMVARAERIGPGFQTAIRNITDDLGLVKSETFGVKQVKSLENKLKRGYELGSVTDPIRTRILINTVQEADEVVNRIAEMMPVQDRGFQQHTTSGYFDRKLNVMYTDPNGERLLGEIQITTPEMLEAVDGKGHRLYEVERALTERYGAEVPTTHIRRFENMQRAQKELYQGVAEKVDPRIVESIEVKPDKDFVSTPPTTQRPVTEAQREAWREANKGDFRQEQTPELSLAAEKLGRGEITIADYAKEVKRLRPIEPLTSVPKISSFEEIASALDKNKVDKGIIGLDKEIVDGTPVGSRLDIPAYNNYDTWVVSVHEGTGVSGKSLGYGKVAVLDNVSFNSNPNAAYGVATGSKDKAPFARMNGEWRNVDPEVARKQAEEYLTNPDWVQVGMNPYRHSFFYDKATGQPLASADEVIQIGPLVLARNSKTRPLESPEHAIKNPKEGQPKYFKKGGSIERVYKEQTYI
jgi:hypothetical protein